ncbi:MAG: hypothetical protein ACW981_08340 [Candidatus Hodarchaeales archaeon]|jgi:hypothetical protein
MNFKENIFEDALVDWKKRSTEQSFVTTIGALHTTRFLGGIREASATAFQKSIYEGADDVHLFKADAVREEIKRRIIQSENRGYIRPWYADCGLWAERTNILRAFPEEDIDFVLRLSLYPINRDDPTPLLEERIKYLEKLDPPIPYNDDGTINEFELGEKKVIIEPYIRPNIELYSCLIGIIKLLFPLTSEERRPIIMSMLKSEEFDKFYRRRFVAQADAEGSTARITPLIGEFHPDLRFGGNFVLKYLAENNEELYASRVVTLWLFALFGDNPGARTFIQKGWESIAIINRWADNKGEGDRLEGYFQLINQGVEYAKLMKIYNGFYHMMRTEYATKLNYHDYATQLYHLLALRDRSIEPFEKGIFPITLEGGRLDQQVMLHQLGVAALESALTKLTNQIPIPKGIANSRMVLIKRKANLRKAVAPENVQKELLESFTRIGEHYETNDREKIEEEFKVIHSVISPRSELYFKEMENRIAKESSESGVYKEELASALETPQMLVKQFGSESLKFMKNDIEDEELEADILDYFTLMLSMKSSELLFDDATTSTLRRKQVTRSLYNDYFIPSMELVKYAKNRLEEAEKESQEESESPTSLTDEI